MPELVLNIGGNFQSGWAAFATGVNQGIELLEKFGRTGEAAFEALDQIFEESDKADDFRSAIAALAGSQQKAAEYTEALRVGSHGLFDEMTSLESTSKLLNTGVVKNAGDFSMLGEASIKLGEVLGQNANEVLPQLIDALQTGRDRAIKLAGVHVDLAKAL